MAASRNQRLQSEYKQLLQSPCEPGIYSTEINENNINELIACIYGPVDTPYYGYGFKVKLTFTDEYPFKPPVVKFITPILHPNVNGINICLDILKCGTWSPIQKIKSILISLASLLSDPNLSDPLDSGLRDMYNKNKAEYITHIQAHCKANGIPI